MRFFFFPLGEGTVPVAAAALLLPAVALHGCGVSSRGYPPANGKEWALFLWRCSGVMSLLLLAPLLNGELASRDRQRPRPHQAQEAHASTGAEPRKSRRNRSNLNYTSGCIPLIAISLLASPTYEQSTAQDPEIRYPYKSRSST